MSRPSLFGQNSFLALRLDFIAFVLQPALWDCCAHLHARNLSAIVNLQFCAVALNNFLELRLIMFGHWLLSHAYNDLCVASFALPQVAKPQSVWKPVVRVSTANDGSVDRHSLNKREIVFLRLKESLTGNAYWFHSSSPNGFSFGLIRTIPARSAGTSRSTVPHPSLA